MSRHTLSVGGVDLTATYGLYVDTAMSYNKPAKNVETISIPGRNGDLVIDYDTFKNVVITYPCFMKGNFDEDFWRLMSALAGMKGYQQIICSNDPNRYREGVPIIQQNPKVKRLNKDGYFDLLFNCKPQRYEYPQTWEEITGSQIYSGSPLTFRPIFKVTGSGTITVAVTHQGEQNPYKTYTITVTSNTGVLYIDCESMECYKDSRTFANNLVTLSPNEYPVFEQGSRQIVSTSGFTKVEINERLWYL